MEKELINIQVTREKLWDLVGKHHLVEGEYKVKQVDVVDDLFKNDKHWHDMKKIADKAYSDLKRYEFRVRHKI